MIPPAFTGVTAPLIQVTAGSARATSTFVTSLVVVKRARGLRSIARATYGSYLGVARNAGGLVTPHHVLHPEDQAVGHNALCHVHLRLADRFLGFLSDEWLQRAEGQRMENEVDQDPILEPLTLSRQIRQSGDSTGDQVASLLRLWSTGFQHSS